jgi:hypothetical protein
MGRIIQHTAFKKGARGTGRKHAEYVAGIGPFAGKEDVVFCADGNLPSWASDASGFFAAADEFERGDYTVKRKDREGNEYEKTIRGRAYLELEWSVPREIRDPVAWAQNVAKEVCGQSHPYRLAVHDAPASDGGRNINMHLMFSDREIDGLPRDRELFFKRAKTGTYRHRVTGELITHNPATGGAKKNRFWNHKSRPQWARKLYEKLVRLEIPDFQLTRSDNPEPKIGPKLKKAGREYEAQRQVIEAIVAEIRALRQEMEAVSHEIANQFREQECSTRPKENLLGKADPRWADFVQAFHDIGSGQYGLSLLDILPNLDHIAPKFTELADQMHQRGRGVDQLAGLFAEQLSKLLIQEELERSDHGVDPPSPERPTIDPEGPEI